MTIDSNRDCDESDINRPLDMALPILDEVGIDICHPVEPESNDLFELKKK